MGAEISPLKIVVQFGPFLAPLVGSKHVSSVGRRYWCLCIACQDQSLCECASQQFFWCILSIPKNDFVYPMCIPRTVFPQLQTKHQNSIAFGKSTRRESTPSNTHPK